MTGDHDEPTIGELVDSLPPGETVRLGRFDLTRWADTDNSTDSREPANRAGRRGNPRQRGRHLARIRRNYGKDT
jgi:hypothetical protein